MSFRLNYLKKVAPYMCNICAKVPKSGLLLFHHTKNHSYSKSIPDICHLCAKVTNTRVDEGIANTLHPFSKYPNLSNITLNCTIALLYCTTVLQYCKALFYYTNVLHYCTALLYYTTVLNYCTKLLTLTRGCLKVHG